MGEQQRPIRILQVVGSMNRGGIETWLMHVLRQIDRTRYQMDFLVHNQEPAAYAAEAKALGSQIIPCLHSEQPWRYAQNLHEIWTSTGPYHVVHSHVHHYSGYILRLARKLGVPVRIAHSHNDTRVPDRRATVVRKSYHTLMKRLLCREATVGLACSGAAAAALYGPRWQTDARWQILHYGIDLQPFATPIDCHALRATLQIPRDAFVIGHVGRFMEQKNHDFLVEIAAAAMQQRPNTYLLLVGEGVLAATIQQKVQALGIADQTIFAGLRTDVPQLMRGAMDLLLLPSLFEGLPVVLLEAQAAGLPCLISDLISEEVDLIDLLVQRQSLQQPATRWAADLLAMAERGRPCVSTQALQKVQASSFNIEQSLHQLTAAYAGAYRG